jgi:hypothetical protein
MGKVQKSMLRQRWAGLFVRAADDLEPAARTST